MSSNPISKGERTRLAILKAGMQHSSQYGLGDVTIGTISKLCQLSRTGVISHFKNKEDMQIAILQYSEDEFAEHVIAKTRNQDSLQRLTDLMLEWRGWTQRVFGKDQIGCPLVKAIVEFQDRPDSGVKRFAIEQQQRFLSYLTHQIFKVQEQGKFTKTLSAETIAYEFYCLYLGHIVMQETLPAEQSNALFADHFNRMITRYQT